MFDAEKVARRNAVSDAPTSNQMSFIKELLETRLAPRGLVEYNRDLWRLGSFNARTASLFIDALLSYPEKERVSQPRPTIEGLHLVNGRLVLVARSSATFLYAKVLTQKADGKWFFKYAGAARNLTPKTKMSIEQIVKFGHMYQICGVCGKELKDAVSIERGIGNDCAVKMRKSN